MSRHRRSWAVATALVCALFAGCGQPTSAHDNAAEAREPGAAAHAHDGEADEHAHRGEYEDEHAHDGTPGAAPASFQEGQGLKLAPETAEALGVTTAVIEQRAIAPTLHVTASVFDAGPPARALAIIPAAVADELERHPPTEAKILSVRRALASALNQVEVEFALADAPALGRPVELRLRGAERNVAAVPRSSVLRTATGTFVYVRRGERFLRTPVITGAGDGAHVEIVDGLRAGAVVAVGAVEQLWLTELRLTKGGGHSH